MLNQFLNRHRHSPVVDQGRTGTARQSVRTGQTFSCVAPGRSPTPLSSSAPANRSVHHAVLLALILWANLPVTALWLVGVLLGLQLISVGAAIAYLAWQVRQS